MVINKLIAKKEMIGDRHLKTIETFILKANKRIDSAMKDEKNKTEATIGFYNSLRTSISIDKSKYLKMDGKERIEYAHRWFDTKDKDIRLLLTRTEDDHKSLLENIDQQIKYYRKELDLIHKEANLIKDKGISNKWKKYVMNRKKKSIERAADL